MATDADDREQQQPQPHQARRLFPGDPQQQQRELEEIRRQFAEVSERVSAFEPAPADEQRERALVLASSIAPPAKQPAPPRWLLAVAVAVAVIFVLGTGFGYVLPRAGSNHPPAPPAPSTAGPPRRAQPQQAQPVPSVPQACLETARRADQMVHLFIVKDRSRRLVQALKAYTLASQACRQQASP